MAYQLRTINRLEILRHPSQLLDNWEFFLEGLEKINENFRGSMRMPADVFLKILLRIVNEGDSWGVVALARNKNDRLVGFFVIQDNTETFFKRTAAIIAAYSTGNNTAITKDMVTFGEEWARGQGYEHIYALSLRTGASIKRLYTRKWGFRLHGLWFRKDL